MMNALKKIMKISIVLCLFLSMYGAGGSTCYGVETEVGYKEVAYNFYRMQFIDPLNGWVAGKSGYLFQTGDGGGTWKRVMTGTENAIFGMHYFDLKRAVIVGQEGLILTTENGGTSWEKVKSPVNNTFLTLGFYDDKIGMAAGDWGKIIATQDGGKSWQDISLEQDILLYKIKYVGPKDVWIAAEMGTIFHSIDGGATWEEKQVADGSLFGIDMNQEGYGIAVGIDGTVLMTSDGGKNWNRDQIGKDSLYSVKMSGDVAVAIGDAGKVFKLNFKKDKTWRKIDTPNELRANWLHAIAGTENGKFIIAGARGSISFIEDGRLKRP